MIRQRYEAADQALRFSLAAILADERGHAAITRLRAEGWLDWQILVAIMNVRMNWRMQQAGIPLEKADGQLAHQIGSQPESEDDLRLPVEFLLDLLDLHMFVQTTSVAQRWQLRGRNAAPGEGALRELIIRRYRYAEDDIVHRDLLDCLAADGTLLPILGT